ncbi:MAG: GatB/YqeY domain-containing protein [Patescibacteria group bacterium]
MGILERLQSDLTDAMKAKREPERTVLRSLTAALKNAAIESGGALDDAKEASVVAKQLKQREESAAAAKGRPELADRERAEAEIIKQYLPERLSDEEVDAAIDAAISETGAAGPGDIGKVMGALKGKTAGRADQGAVAAKVKERLGA